MPVTVQDVAKHRGMRTSEDGSFSMADINAVGFSMLGGCEDCEASIACYNAYPSRSGFWRCEDCIGDQGYETVEEANAEIFGDVPKPQEVKTVSEREAYQRELRNTLAWTETDSLLKCIRYVASQRTLTLCGSARSYLALADSGQLISNRANIFYWLEYDAPLAWLDWLKETTNFCTAIQSNA